MTELRSDLGSYFCVSPYSRRHPGVADLALVVEVAETSLGLDGEVKVPGYAAAGVVDVWLVSLPERRVTLHSRPVPAERRFAQVVALGPGDTTVHTPTGLSVPLAEVLIYE